MSPFLMPAICFLIKKIQSWFLKLNKLDFLIFWNVKFLRPIRAEGRKNLTKHMTKMTGTDIYEFTINFGPCHFVIFLKNCVNVLTVSIWPPPTLFRVKRY